MLKSPLVLLGTVLACGSIAIADSPLDRASPEARRRFEDVASAYKSLAAYADAGTFTRSTSAGEAPRVETAPLSVRFVRPNRIVLDAGEVRIVGDGKLLTTLLVPTKKFLSAPSPASLSITPIADGPAGAILLGGPSGSAAQLVLKLVLGAEPVDALPDRATGLAVEDDRPIEGKPFQVLRIDQGEEPAIRLLIDPQSRLIRRVETVLDDASVAAKSPSGSGLKGMTMAWDSGPIATDAPKDDAFRFQEPAGFARIKAPEPKPAAAEAKNEFVGKISPDFTLTVLDGPGKTKKVTRADLAGKVVVLDFWATWCGPCMQELPEIQKLAESYAKAKKTEVVILAVSQDRAPEDGKDVRKLVEDTLEAKKLDLLGGPIARVALDPEQAVGELFKVEGIPTVVILDAKGVVQSVHVGYSEDVKDVLAGEIDALLEGKALAPAEPKK